MVEKKNQTERERLKKEGDEKRERKWAWVKEERKI